LFIVKHEKNGLFMIVKDCLRLFWFFSHLSGEGI
jgi:hypothetical protein